MFDLKEGMSKWLIEGVLRRVVPAIVLALLGALVDVGLLDGAVYEAVRAVLVR